MDRFWVGMQSALSALIGVLAVLCTGHKSGLPVVVVLIVGATIWAICVWWFVARSDAGDRKVWHDELRQGLAQGIVGLGVPLIVAVIAWQSPSLEGWLFSTAAAAFGATTLVIIPVALLASSMIDRFVILPRLLGLTGPDPVWRPAAVDDRSRRRVAQGWVAHRGFCELFVFTAIAVVLAVALVAVINEVSHDETVPTALESLGGAGIAVYIFGLSGPRHAQAVTFCLSGPVVLGNWVRGRDEYGNQVEGFVLDVSVHPGVKLVSLDDERNIIPLKNAPSLNPVPRRAGADVAWCRDKVLEHLLKLNKEERTDWPGPPP
jgi:hypothetical protein